MPGKESDRFKRRWLEWAFNFPNINSKTLFAGEFYNLNAEALFFCSSQFRFETEESFFKGLTRKRYDRMEGKINLAELQKALKPIVKFITSFNGRPNGKLGSPVFRFSQNLPTVEVAIEAVESGHFEIVNSMPDDYLSNALWNLAKLIDHLSLDSVIRCKGCRRSFVDLSKAKKNYCTSSCAARYNARIKRDDLKQHHPKKYKAYLKDQRERMFKLRAKSKGIHDTVEREDI